MNLIMGERFVKVSSSELALPVKVWECFKGGISSVDLFITRLFIEQPWPAIPAFVNIAALLE